MNRRRCLEPGCFVLSPGTRCEPHRLAKQRDRRYSRPAAERDFYSSRSWRALRLETLEAAGYRCEARTLPDGQFCGAPAATGGHVIPVRQRPDLGLEPANVFASCARHQNLAQTRPPGALLPR